MEIQGSGCRVQGVGLVTRLVAVFGVACVAV